jgi:hypothetical protein
MQHVQERIAALQQQVPAAALEEQQVLDGRVTILSRAHRRFELMLALAKEKLRDEIAKLCPSQPNDV